MTYGDDDIGCKIFSIPAMRRTFQFSFCSTNFEKQTLQSGMCLFIPPEKFYERTESYFTAVPSLNFLQYDVGFMPLRQFSPNNVLHQY